SAHDILDAEEMLEVGGLDHVEENDGAAGAAHPIGSKCHGPGAFLAVVDDHEEFALVVANFRQSPTLMPTNPVALSHGSQGGATQGLSVGRSLPPRPHGEMRAQRASNHGR